MEQIIIRYLEGIATEEEQRRLLEWLRDRNNRAAFNGIKTEWGDRKDAPFNAQQEESWNSLKGKLWLKNYKIWRLSERRQLLFRYAAVFLLIIAVGCITYIFNNLPEKTPDLAVRVIADKGQISRVELPDGSTIWLNSGSEIKYNNQFALDNREVSLVGEAYFKVASNAALPFMVKCNNIQVKALGTGFNVSSYPGSGFIEVILEDGSVELRNSELTNFSYDLKPGKMARFNLSEAKLSVTDVNTVKYTSWKDGVIHIYDQPFSAVIERLELRYNQKFIFEDAVKEFRYTFTIKNESLEEIIRLMEKITPVKAIQKENVIIFRLDKNKVKNVG